MIKRKAGQPVLAEVISILLLYIALIIMILIFAGRLLSDISAEASLERLKILGFSLVLPIFLIASIVINIIRLVKQKKNKTPGASFKAKLLVFFTFLSLLSAVPQGILSLSFINTALNSWFSSGTGEALENGLEFALDYNKHLSSELQSFSKSRIYENILTGMMDSPDRMWSTILSVHPMISTLEIYGSEGNLIIKKGDESLSSLGISMSLSEGVVSRYTQKDRTALKIQRDFTKDGRKYSAVISAALPKNFDAKASNITRIMQLYSRFEFFYNKLFAVLILFFVYFSLPILLLSILTSFLLSDEIIKPIVHLEEAISRVIEGDFSYRILTKQKDDLANLVNSFNKMVSELDQSRQNLVQNEKVSAWQEIAQRMAHEIKNPLTPIKLSAQRILKKFNESPESLENILPASTDAIIKEVENLTKLIEQFRDFAKMPVPNPSKINLREYLEQIIPLYSGSFPGVDIDISGVTDVSLMADPDLLKSVFSNLLSNAIESLKGGKGRIVIQADEIVKGNSRYCRIQIQDDGIGMNSDIRKKIFNPYFTTKEGGTGLGLPIIERIISEHSGRIWLESEEGTGTTFFMDLPSANKDKEYV